MEFFEKDKNNQLNKRYSSEIWQYKSFTNLIVSSEMEIYNSKQVKTIMSSKKPTINAHNWLK